VKLYCTVCRRPLPEIRKRRGSPYCRDECREKYRRWRRNWRAERFCRLCGRGVREPKCGPQNLRATASASRAQRKKQKLVPRAHKPAYKVESSVYQQYLRQLARKQRIQARMPALSHRVRLCGPPQIPGPARANGKKGGRPTQEPKLLSARRSRSRLADLAALDA
jgi:hypothetical protein